MIKKLLQPKNYILLGIPILFLIGIPMHFIYEWSREFILIGLFAPVNESIFEHLKLILLPMTLWWSIYFFINKRKLYLNFNKWFTALFFALISSLITIPLLYYFYTYGLNIESIILDILSLLTALSIGQTIGWYLYQHFRGFDGNIMIAIILSIFVIFIFLTFLPPKLPLFIDETTKQYGIGKIKMSLIHKQHI